jgi:RNA polymerase sigma-B factor
VGAATVIDDRGRRSAPDVAGRRQAAAAVRDLSAGSSGPTDELELFRRLCCDGDEQTREELVRRHLPLARALASRYGRTQEPFDDLVQVASLGLVKAIDRFDPDRGLAFSSFAVPTILGELKRHFRDKGWSVHLPRGLQELVLRVQAADAELGAGTSRSPTVVEIAEHLSVDTETVLEALEAMAAHNAASLDAPIDNEVSDDAATPHDTIGAEDDGYALVDASASLADAMRGLRKADREVFTLRFRDELSQREIADRIGVSQMQVSRMLRRATDQLRGAIKSDQPAGSQ